MPGADDIKQLKLNQNLWGLLLSLGALGAADYFRLSAAFWWLSFVLAIVIAISVLITTGFYTFHYCKKKCEE